MVLYFVIGRSVPAIGGSKVVLVTCVPFWSNFISFSCRFWQLFGQIIGWCTLPHPGVGVPPLGNPESATACDVNLAENFSRRLLQLLQCSSHHFSYGKRNSWAKNPSDWDTTPRKERRMLPEAARDARGGETGRGRVDDGSGHHYILTFNGVM